MPTSSRSYPATPQPRQLAQGLALSVGALLSACGNSHDGSPLPSLSATQQPSSPAPKVRELTLLAGAPSGQGYVDGQRADARFSYPQGLAFDAAGTMFVADARNHVIRRIDASGKVSTLAGMAGVSGSADGAGNAARFNSPYDVTVDAVGNVFVADTNNSTIRKITPSGVVTTLAGSAGQSGLNDGKGDLARFTGPNGIAIDRKGNLYVADTYAATVRKIAPDGSVTTLAGSAGATGHADGQGAEARFLKPTGIAVDAGGTVYVADTDDNTVRRILPDGSVDTLAGSAGQSGSADGSGDAARFNGPAGVAVDPAGGIVVMDGYNSTLRRVGLNGSVTTLAGTAGQVGNRDGAGKAALLKGPGRVTFDAAGNAYVSDNNSAIRKVAVDGTVSTWAGATAEAGSTDGPGAGARFSFPNGIAVDAQNNVYVADQDNGLVRKIGNDGKVTTLAGKAGTWNHADGIGTGASFAGIGGLAIDAGGNVYVTEFSGQTVRKVAPNGAVATIAGIPWTGGYLDGKGADAQFNSPNNLAVDKAGNLYVADCYNNAVRKITPEGDVDTLAGGTAGSADGTGKAAQFNCANSIALDPGGNLLVTDSGNNTVRKVTPGGVVTTIAGQPGTPGNQDGIGNAARFNYPWGIATDAGGTIYVADSGNNSVRRIDAGGKVDTLIGGGSTYRNAQGKLPAGLAYPIGLAIDATGSTLYITAPDAVLKANVK